jgi:(p)ppGpp synthase/HD superfamily hydrolase
MDPMHLLELALRLTLEAHAGQRDRAGKPYVLHPLRVMHGVEGEQAQAAALLHDVVEDTDTGLDDLRRAGFPAAVVAAVDALTKREGEVYESYLERVAADEIARRVKRADIADNLRLQRLPEVEERDLERLNRYLAALRRLER